MLLAIPISNKAIADDSYLTYDQLAAFQAKQAEEEWSRQLVAYAETLKGTKWEWCVIGVRKYFGVPYSELRGAARSNKPDTQTPEIGSVIIMNMSKWGHVGMVIAKDDNKVTYIDWNGGGSGRGTIRTIAINDKRIIGYKIVK